MPLPCVLKVSGRLSWKAGIPARPPLGCRASGRSSGFCQAPPDRPGGSGRTGRRGWPEFHSGCPENPCGCPGCGAGHGGIWMQFQRKGSHPMECGAGRFPSVWCIPASGPDVPGADGSEPLPDSSVWMLPADPVSLQCSQRLPDDTERYGRPGCRNR